jgi:hypothetical protein
MTRRMISAPKRHISGVLAAIFIISIAVGGCGEVPEAGTIAPREQGVRPNRVRGKAPGSDPAAPPAPAEKGR